MSNKLCIVLAIVASILLATVHFLVAFFCLHLPIWASVLYGIAVVVAVLAICAVLNKLFGDKAE